MIRAAIFDLNGIFIHSPKLSERVEKDFGVPVAEFVPALSKIMDQTRKPGAGDSFGYWKPLFEKRGIALSEQEFWDYWFKAETQSDAMIAYAKKLKAAGIKIFVLSNNFKERAACYRRYPWMADSVDRAYFSCETGFVKPDPKAWKSILSEHGLKGEECLYFDDQEKNVKAAESVGIKAFLFKDQADLETTVEKLRV